MLSKYSQSLMLQLYVNNLEYLRFYKYSKYKNVISPVVETLDNKFVLTDH